jgi:exodeoxyribonuclease VII large subunit
VALLPVPVIASVGHHTDRTLLDDVAAVTCSTPTHAAEAAVGLDVREAQAALVHAARRLQTHSRRAILDRARTLAALSRAPGRFVARERERLHQKLREIRASGARRVAREGEAVGRAARTLDRTVASSPAERRRRDLDRLLLALDAHDPQRTLERGYALVSSRDGTPLSSADAARDARDVTLRFADGTVDAEIEDH